MCRLAAFALFVLLTVLPPAQAQQATLELLSPREDRPTTSRDFVNVLGRTTPGYTVRVAGETVTVFATGVFARDRVPLALGLNRITIEAVAAGGSVTSRVLEVERLTPQPPVTALPPALPDAEVPLSPGEVVEVIGPDVAELLHGVHEVRLGGPFIAEAAAGTRLLATARRGDLLRVLLAPGFSAWLPRQAVQPQTNGSVPMRLPFTHFSISGNAEGDVVNIPLATPLAYAVRALPGALEIDLFGTHLAATWISHRASARLVREATVEALGDERVRIRLALNGARGAAAPAASSNWVWGWRVEQVTGAMRLIVRAPPVIANTGSPLNGLHVALEAGHGSAENTGAIGATGTPEKDINRWTTDALAAELRAVGATVTMAREGDDNPAQRERARRVLASPAQLFVSVHANSADTTNGFLRVSGTSHYFKSSHSRDLAAAVHKQMLALTGLEDFGVVGNFNYAPVRLVTSMPSILVEQAFVSHPGDEAKLLDPAFRALMARAVRQGIEDFLRSTR